jgi:deoxyribose-phosphate aldolase
MKPLTRREVAQMVDHTLLKPEATAADADALIDQGVSLGVYAVCISPSLVPRDARGLHLAVVCGFPSGAHYPEVKAAEAARARGDGIDELDMVINLGWAMENAWDRVREEIAAVRQAVPPPHVLKVIIESAALTDQQIVQACLSAQDAGADFVKTSTGFHPAGGATTHAVELMAATVGGALGVKASGGIRTGAAALDMIRAGATRLGLSATAQILAEIPE